MLDRRSEPRKREPITCKLVLGDERVVDGIVQNRSRAGAHLLLPESVVVPVAFRLSIGPIAEQLDATVIWRRADELGVRIRPVLSADRSGKKSMRSVFMPSSSRRVAAAASA